MSIYDENFKEIVKYTYDAWGNHKIVVFDGSNFVDINLNEYYNDNSEFNNNKFIAELNPFRYRSYYYDAETGFYYLNSRYYDSEIGRFINADNISILNDTREFLNGINLYSYCLNNPVNYLDFNGNIAIGLLIVLGLLIGGAIAGGTIAGIESNKNGNSGGDILD